jgi:protein phosphatase
VYLLCSDGLSGMIPDEEILATVEASGDTPEICRRLIALANQNGGEDSITVLAIRFDDGKPESEVTTAQTMAPPSLDGAASGAGFDGAASGPKPPPCAARKDD